MCYGIYQCLHVNVLQRLTALPRNSASVPLVPLLFPSPKKGKLDIHHPICPDLITLISIKQLKALFHTAFTTGLTEPYLFIDTLQNDTTSKALYILSTRTSSFHTCYNSWLQISSLLLLLKGKRNG